MRAGTRRGVPFIAAIVVLALLALHGAAWLWATERLRSGYASWAAAMRAAGWTVDGGAPQRAGWPFAAELAIPGPLLSGGDALVPGGMAWTAERVRLRLSPRSPRTLDILPEGAQRLRLAALPEATITAASLAAAVPLSGEGAAELGGRAVRVAAAGVAVEAATLRAWVTPGDVRAEMGEIALPEGYAWPLGATIAAASAEMLIVGAATPAPNGATAAEQAARWRDAGGRVDVPAFAMRWGPLNAAGSGTGGLDARLQPRAEATLHMQGWEAALGRLVQGGAVAPGAALAARAALGLFARASQGAPPGTVRVPVLVQDGLAYAGGIPLLRVPTISWP